MAERLNEKTTMWNKDFMCAVVAHFLLCVAHFSSSPLIVTYVEHLGAGVRLAGLLTGLFFGIALAFRPIVGPAMTRLDKRKLLIFVFILGAISNVGYALFPSISAFVFFRFLGGAQFSFVGTLLMALAADHLPRAKLPAGMGIYGTGSAIGNAIAPSAGEAIFRFGTSTRGENYGFTLMFLFGAAMLILALIPTLILVPDKKTKEEIASTGAWYKNMFTVHAIPTTIVMLFLTIPYSMIFAYMFEFSREQGIAGVNVFFIVLACTLAVTRPIGGYLIYKFGISPIMFPAFVLFALSFVFIGSITTFNMMLFGAFITAIGFGFSQPTIQAMCIQTETPLRRGVATNTIHIAMDLGLFIGPIIGGLVRYQANFSVMFRIGVIPVILAIICFAIIMPIHKRRLEKLEIIYNQDAQQEK